LNIELHDWLSQNQFDVTPTLDGQIKRFGEKKAQWFVGHELPSKKEIGQTIVIATVGDWRTGDTHKFQSGTIKKTRDEQREIARLLAQQKRIVEQNQTRAFEEAALDAAKFFDSYKTPHATDYTRRKKVEPDQKTKIGVDTRGGVFLAVPLFDTSGKLWSFQKIYDDGSKLFFTGGKKRGNYFYFGDPNQNCDTVYVCEGYATGYSVHKKFNSLTICAMDAGNMPAVAHELKEKYADAEFIYAADRDPSGIGEKRALEAAAITGGKVILPPEPHKDFNDAASENYELEQLETEAIQAPMPDLTKAGKPRATLENLEHLLRFMNVTVRYNVITKDEEILIPGEAFSQDNRANCSLTWIVSQAARANMPTDKVDAFTSYLADKNPYNPVATWITSSEWDGKDRLCELYATVRTKDNDHNSNLLKQTLLTRWLLSAVAAAFEPHGVSAHGVLTFQGGQNLGKTAWFKRLVPQHMRLTKDGVILRPDDRDSVKQALQHWLVELGELDATFKKSDIAQLKAFLTADRDVFRRAYARRESEYARRTVFFASVNPTSFLHDTTGNRRFWTVACESLDYNHSIDMQQLWAQVYAMYKDGDPWVLSKDELEMLNAHNENFQSSDPIEELVGQTLCWDASDDLWTWKTCTDIAREIGIQFPKPSDLNAISRSVRKFNGNRHGTIDRMRKLFVPPRKS